MSNINNKNEIQIQSQVIQYFWNKYPETRYCLYHIANEGKRSVQLAGQMKASGLVAGIQDLHFVWNGVTYHIELKDNNGSVSIAQKVVHSAHARQGIMTWLFRDAESCIGFLEFIVLNNPGYQTLELMFPDFWSPYAIPDRLEFYEEQLYSKKRYK